MAVTAKVTVGRTARDNGATGCTSVNGGVNVVESGVVGKRWKGK